MSTVMTKYQKQSLGRALAAGGNKPENFVYLENHQDDSYDTVNLIHRDTSDKFTIRPTNLGYSASKTVPGTGRELRHGSMQWDELMDVITSWSRDIKRENEAIDPWQQEAEEMADDDSYFNAVELPKVDRAIDESLAELKNKAIEHGISLQRIDAELLETNKLLKRSARNSSKKEWIALFKGIIIEKLVDWGMQTIIFQNILQTLITSSHDIAQLAEHASRHLP